MSDLTNHHILTVTVVNRAGVLARVAARPPAKTADDEAANAADLLRLGNGGTVAYADKALNTLFRYRGGRQPSYFALTTLAAVHAALLSHLKTGDRLVASRALFGSCHWIV